MSLHRLSWAALFAGIALSCAQILLANHEIEHFADFDADACEMCLNAGPVGSSLPPASVTFHLPPALPYLQCVADPASLSESCTGVRHARAPPALGPMAG